MITLDTITLNSDLVWVDENSWHPVEQAIQRTITGALIVSSSARLGGRPITLQPEDESSAWMSASVLTDLRNLTVVPGKVMSLTVGGISRDVIFRHHEGSAIEAVPVIHYSDGADWYRITLRLMEI